MARPASRLASVLSRPAREVVGVDGENTGGRHDVGF